MLLTETYIEALLVDEELADEIWEAWNSGLLDDLTAAAAWLLVAKNARLSLELST